MNKIKILKQTVSIILLLIASLLPACSQSNAEATLSPVSTYFIKDEPVQLIFNVANPGTHPLSIPVYYPDFASTDHFGIRLKITSDISARDKARPRRNENVGGVGRTAILPLNPGGSLTFRIPMQEFFSSLPEGDYQAEYWIDIRAEYGPGLGGPRRDLSLRGEGTFLFVIGRGEPDELNRVLQRHFDELLKAQEELTANFWVARGEKQGLLLVPNPVVIPYLTRLNWDTPAAVRAMSKFPGSEAAHEFVLANLRSGRTRWDAEALRVLSEWKYPLPPDEVARYMSSKDRTLRLAAVQYAVSIPGDEFIPALRLVAEDLDEQIATLARRRLTYP